MITHFLSSTYLRRIAKKCTMLTTSMLIVVPARLAEARRSNFLGSLHATLGKV